MDKINIYDRLMISIEGKMKRIEERLERESNNSVPNKDYMDGLFDIQSDFKTQLTSLKRLSAVQNKINSQMQHLDIKRFSSIDDKRFGDDEFVVLSIPYDPSIIDNNKIIDIMNSSMTFLSEQGAISSDKEVIQDFNIEESNGRIKVVVKRSDVLWVHKLKSRGVGMSPMIDMSKILKSMNKVYNKSDERTTLFSASTIKERLKLSQRNPRVRFRYMVMDYKRYFDANKSKLGKDKELFSQLKNMFLTDMMGVFSSILPQIQEGNQLATLLGTSQISPELNKSARKLSIAYRKALVRADSSGDINRNLYGTLKEAYTEFMTKLMDTIFSVNEEFNPEEEEQKSMSKSRSGRTIVFSYKSN